LRRQDGQEPTLSTTTLFVANLPFETNEEDLIAIFKEFNPQKARVARYRNRSKGFGFIELDNQENQQKASEKMNGFEVLGRPLNVKIAVVDLSSQAEEQPQPIQDS